MRFGSYEVHERGARPLDRRDPYRLAVGLSWGRFAMMLLAAEVALNLGFALLYLLRPGSIANAHPGSLSDAFFFSIETLATVGYGEMYPADLYGHVVSAVEIVTGVAFVAVVTGLIFVRASRPRSPFRFPDQAVVARVGGERTLMIRIASEAGGLLYNAEARLSLLMAAEPGAGHGGSHDVVDLPLARADIPVFPLAWTLAHVLDAQSPLAGMDQVRMAAAGVRLFLTVRADDATLSATVRDLRAYAPADLRFGMRYAEAITTDERGHPTLDLDQLGALEPDL